MANRSSASKSSAKTSSGKKSKKVSKGSGPIDLKAVKAGTLSIYGDVLRQAKARGDINEMRKVAALAKTLIKDSQGALRRLEDSIKSLEG
jgi:hypothetical protein